MYIVPVVCMGEPDYIINKILSTVKSIINEVNSM
jgi:hypothetical protein